MAPRSTRQSALNKKHVARLERERRQTRMIVWGAATIVAIVLGLIGYSVLNDKFLKPRQPVARVGEEVITTAQFQARVRLQRQQIISQYAQYYQFGQMFGMDFTAQLQQLQDQLADFSAEPLGQSVLDSMINELLMNQEAERLGITVSDAEIEKRMETAFGYYPNGEPTATVTATEFTFPTLSAEQAAIVTITPTPGTPTATATLTAAPTATLDLTTTATANLKPTTTPTSTATSSPTVTSTPAPTFTPEPTATPLSQTGFDEKLTESMKSLAELGFNETEYRRLIRIELLRDLMFERVTGALKPVEEQVWARHILVENKIAATTVYNMLMRGQDFGKLAATFSKDPGSKDLGGDLGWFARGAMVGPFEDAAFSIAPGEIGQPIQSDFGWHIIQVIGHEDRPLTTDQFEQLKQDAFTKWVEDLRAKAEADGLIEIFDFWKERVPLEPTLESAFGQQ